MRARVLTDPVLAGHAGRFVWLSVNGENAASAAFLEKVDVGGYPTFFVIDPRTETVAVKWPGSLTTTQLVALFDDGERAVRAGTGTGPEDLMARADRLAGADQYAEAAPLYAEALRAGGPGWTGRLRALDAWVGALSASKQWEPCAQLALDEAPALPRGPTFANLAVVGLDCADSAPEDAAWRGAAQTRLATLVEESLGIEEVLADDRSSLYGILTGRLQDREDEAGAKAMSARWLAFLEAEAARAESPEARAAFDSHRVNAAIVLGEPQRALPALEASERDLPGDYNPPARQAYVYRAMGRYDEAVAASRRALSKAYGPRKLRLYDVMADAQAKGGDREGARATLEEAIRHAEALPEAQRPKTMLEALRKRLEELRASR